jgi:hypothetical protein
MEFTRESVPVTLEAETKLHMAKTDRVKRAAIGKLVSVKINTKRCLNLNESTGMRMDV